MSLMSQPRAVTHLVGVVHSEDVSLEFFCVRPGVTLLHHCVERFPRYSTIWMHFEEVLIATLRNNLFINISISAESPLNTSTWSFDKAVFLAINSISSFVRILLAWAQPILITIKAGNSQMMGSVWSNDQVHSNVKLLLWPCVDLTHCLGWGEVIFSMTGTLLLVPAAGAEVWAVMCGWSRLLPISLALATALSTPPPSSLLCCCISALSLNSMMNPVLTILYTP